ncbi:MAG TPA: alpha/beta hydrolase [Spirochaetota bacterium]|nr:alpha/beta hydrolase [Spirochaetota bacterium]HOK92477.1 alpha/beta hydrolase [Spirochaetota bacterium]HPP95658.1 alpha/beta hydrolase [Spirochaetota bacterium]
MSKDKTLPLVNKEKINDMEIEYLHYPSNGQSLLMLHATGFLPWLWHPIASRLNEEYGYNIYAPYLCEHRDIDSKTGALSWNTLAEDLIHFCKNLKLKESFVIGHSMGATIATLCAGMKQLSPKAMVLIEPIFLPQETYSINITVEQHPLASKSIRRKSHWHSKEEAINYLRSKKLFEEWDDEILDLYVNYGMNHHEDGSLTLKCSPEREAALFMGGNAKNPWPLLSHLQCPVLIIEGGMSENRAFIDLKYAASLIPNGHYKMIEEAGHLIPMEEPEETLKAMAEFFESLH